MNILSLVPESYRGVVDLIIAQVPFLKCVLEGHDPLPLVAGTKREPREGVKQVRLCNRCHLAFWEEPK